MREKENPNNPSRHWSFTARNYNTMLPPGPLAENLEPQLAIAGMRHCMTLRKAEGHFLSAWHHVEYALNQNVTELDDSLRRKYMGDALYLLGSICGQNTNDRRRVSPNLYAQAMTLSIFLPVFTKRALQRPVTRRDCRDVYSSFGHVFEDVLNEHSTDDSSYKPARFAEMIGFCLSARAGVPDMLLYPASPREESSVQSSLNHDGYFIKRGVKLPLQTKLRPTNRTYGAPTDVIVIEPIARHALERAKLVDKGESMPFGAATMLLSDLVVQESVHGSKHSAERQALDYATRSIAGRYRYVRSDVRTAS